MEPISHFFYSDRLKLQFWDYGRDGRLPGGTTTDASASKACETIRFPRT